MTATVSAAFDELYTSPAFITSIEEDWLPWLREVLEPGRDLLDLEAGPGFGLLRGLRAWFERVTAARIVPTSGSEPPHGGTEVETIEVDPTALPFPAACFDAATAVLSLHHLRSPADQDRLLSELCRVVKPGGIVAGLNAIDGPHFRRLDSDGTCTPIEPLTFRDRLCRLGLVDVDMTVWSFVRFSGRVPHATAVSGQEGRR